MELKDLIEKSKQDERLSKDEVVHLLSYDPDSPEAYKMMWASNDLSKKLTGNQAEVHGQFALNLSPCDCNCQFCSFSSENKIFTEKKELSVEEIVKSARLFETSGANAIFVMTTAGYSFDRFIEVTEEIKSNLKDETVLIANVGDKTIDQAKRLKDAGYNGVYHALRLGEGKVTKLDPERRKKTINTYKEVGLEIGTCVEPVGPEHSNEELAETILYTASFNPLFSGAARRITIPGGPLEKYGMISELRMAQIVAVTRLAMPHSVKGNCTHEPCTLGAMAGANLFWAEIGANPRDTRENTEEGRGDTVEHCQSLFKESGWDLLESPSVYCAER